MARSIILKQEQTHNRKADADSIGSFLILGAFVYASCLSAFRIAMYEKTKPKAAKDNGI
ncbi:hypothetical protein EYH65_21325 [Bacillus subtilis]|nr:hypothetical protein [Bacillus subtilis]